MPRRTQVSRADLLECLHAYGEAYFEGMASALGYVYQQPIKEIRVEVPGLPLGIALGLPTITTGSAVMPKARFYRVVENRLLKPEEVVRNEPVWFQRAEPLQEDELRTPVGVSPTPQLPLLPWSRLWPFLKTALGARQTTRTLDISRILARLARAQTLRYLPRRQRHGWAAESRLIVDYAEPLLPFWTDFNQLYQRLRRLRGARGLRLIAFPDGDPSGRCWRHDGREWRESGDGPMLGAGGRVLVLSDLGCNDPGDVRRRQWRYLGARLRRAGCRPVALMPCPPRWWDGELTRLFEPVGWDRGARLPKRLGERQRAPASSAPRELDSGAERLLALLAPAIRIEPALLRAVRYLLPAREADVGCEAAAWNHPKVHATPLAFYYDPEAIAGYRRAFQDQDAGLRREVAGLIVAHHLHLSPAISYEERGVLANLQDACDLKAQRFMARIVRMLRDRNDAMAESAQAWVGRLTPRQHEAMWQDAALAAAWALVNQTALREGQVTPPPGLDLGRVSWVFGPDRALKHYTLRQRGPALYLEADAPAALASELDAPGSPVADLGAAADYVQVQRLETSDQSIQPLDQAILLPASGRLRLKTDYQELVLDSIERPEWVEAIGRDEQGLFVAWQDGKRRARWVNPGTYPLYNLSGKQFGKLDITSGCWGEDEPRAIMQPYKGFRQPDWAIKSYPSIPEVFMTDAETARRIIQITLTAGRRRLNAYETSKVLDAYAIAHVPLYFVSTPEAASEISMDLREPVVLKILSPDIVRKTDAGGVDFNLNNPLEVLVAATDMLERVRDLVPNAVIDGFAVQPMKARRNAYELMIGVRTSRQFGPVIFFGQGGTEFEVIDDVAYALPPPNMDLARELISRTRLYRRLSINRSRPVDLDAIALTLLKVSRMVIDLGEVVELDINPIWADENGLVTLDANMLIEPVPL